MKHILPCITLFLMLTASTHVMGQDTYEILRIYNAESITIGNRPKKVGDTFKSTDRIDFANDRQSFLAQKKGTNKIYSFNKASMKAKEAKKSRSFNKDHQLTKGSTRGLSGNVPAIRQGRYDVNKYPEKRIALVIGNSNYQEMEMLPNAINDARDVSDRLKQLGFDVATLYDGDIYDMQTTVTSFFQVAQSYQVALIYFAGHGIRYEGKDYLLSVDRGDMSIRDECSLDYLIDESEKWKSSGKVMIFVIDACRNNVGFNDDERVPSAKRGTAILQSTSSGEVAMDANAGSGNSPFATAFINGIGQSGNDIEKDFSDIRGEVRKRTNESQIPRTSLGGGYNFCFCKGCNTTTSKSNILMDTIKTPPNQNNITLQAKSDSFSQISEYTKKGVELYNQKKYTEAFKLFKTAAEGGNAEGQYWLGYCYYRGQGHSVSLIEGSKWMYISAEQGFQKAINFIKEKKLDYPSNLYRRAKRDGNYEAQFQIGLLYQNGDDVPQSYTEAAKWYRMAAEQGYAEAQLALSDLYDKGFGVPQSYDTAFLWTMAAAKQGLSKAQYDIGMYYLHGLGCKASQTKSKKWLLKAAEQGVSDAQCIIGWSHLFGMHGFKQNGKKAEKWLLLAAKQGDAEAQYYLGYYYELSDGLSQFTNYLPKEALKWYQLSADKGYIPAKKRLESYYSPQKGN